ncbi:MULTISPECIES: tRNA pseudouridine(38-40) synthase TruA [Aequorivita]|uniref:tRNA pseudouridine synthase A n=1 Tax=Aequorivita iocasae TaxID=2803865 RepID=A0ABX7DRX7_9FLAO|nr:MULTISPECIES: tRNA pseudouridine(38-40) synthase TruA [Aequorivita]QQX76910.1 tRNA pseudouridine(38-40) synthase TruA [Aequorivita iocasae]UCA56387.1 tRNA pseudouridine(38-40) synthase TruA [Aequorivita sp. F7]
MRYFIEIAYNGKNYFGWQRQPEQISVQQVLEETISTLLRKDIKLTGAGRTDTGVHAKQLFAHFDFDEIENFDEFIFRMNSFLPKDISVKNIFEVTEDAHARFDAVEREYEYLISLKKDPFSQDFAFQINNKPALDLMNQAAEMLFTHRDFQCFSRSKTDVKTYNCTIVKAFWKATDNKLIFTIAADRFLRNMVRAIVGTLLDVGYGKTTLEEFKRILKSKRREEAGASAPAHGLYLTKVIYPDNIKA